MSLFGQTKRHSLSTKSNRRAPLPIFSSDPEKRYGLSGPGSPIGLGGSSSSWYSILHIPLPNLPFSRSSSDSFGSSRAYQNHHNQRYCRLYVPLPPKVVNRIPRPTSVMRLIIGVVVMLVIGLFLLGFRKRPDGRNTWSPPFTDPNTLVLTPEELAMIWEWEVLSGHYPNLSPRKFCPNLSRWLGSLCAISRSWSWS
jgi:WD repeat and SOF domain-containing protein 1